MAIGYPLPRGGFVGLQYAATFHGDSTLTYTPSVAAGNLQQVTVSVWIRHTNRTAAGRDILSAGADSSNVTQLTIDSSNTVVLSITSAGSVVMNLGVVDPISIADADWHHICGVLDLANATRSLRGRLWVDNVEANAGGDAQRPNNTSTDGHFCDNVRHDVGSFNATRFWTGITADVHIVQGLVLDPTYFGETVDSTWVWKRYSAAHGTNGLWMQFADPSDVGKNSA